ncbi:MAG: AAA family ATPase [Candidatus Caldarchaeum sp.]
MKLRRIRLRNWKSFKDTVVELNDGLNVLVGPNASGKTNLLEAFKFLRKALGDITSPYAPHLEWWSYRNIVYGNDETKPITFELEFECPENYKATYEVAFTNIEQMVRPIQETINLHGVAMISREGDILRVVKEKQFIEEHINTVREYIIHRVKRHGIKIEDITRGTETVILEKIPISILPTLSSFDIIAPIVYRDLAVENKIALTNIRTREMVFTLNGQRTRATRINLISPYLEDKNDSLFQYVTRNIRRFFRGVSFIRHPDMGKVREPSIMAGFPDTPSERGETLNLLIARMFLSGALPERIENALKNLFPDFAIQIKPTADGRVFLSVTDKLNGAEIHPPSIPDGFYKLLHILTAVESKPSVLCIDELENSLHSEVLEYVVHELKNSGVLCLVATHSPVVVDVAGLESLLLVERTPEGSVVKRVENLEQVRRWMKEKGLTPSEMWLYGLQ